MAKKNKKLSVRQLRAIDLMANPSNVNMKNNEIGEKVGVSGKTVSKWKSDPMFQEALTARIKKSANALLPYAWDCLRERMPKDTQALKLYFTLLGEYKDDIQLSGPGGGPIQFSWLRKLSEEELEKLGEGLD